MRNFLLMVSVAGAVELMAGTANSVMMHNPPEYLDCVDYAKTFKNPKAKPTDPFVYDKHGNVTEPEFWKKYEGDKHYEFCMQIMRWANTHPNTCDWMDAQTAPEKYIDPTASNVTDPAMQLARGKVFCLQQQQQQQMKR